MLDLVRFLVSLRKSNPIRGISPSRGTLVFPLWTSSEIRPPMTSVLPLGMSTVVRISRVLNESTRFMDPFTTLDTGSPSRITLGLTWSLM